MIFDANELQTGNVLRADFCIIGGGAAGITLALALADSGKNIVIVEGGGFEASQLSTALYLGERAPSNYLPMHQSRLRFLGGSTNHWGGWTAPLFDTDFQRRSHVDGSGWPIPPREIRRFERQAAEILQLQGTSFDVDEWQQNNSLLKPFTGQDLQTHLYRLSPPTRFGEVYRQPLKAAGNIYLLMNANAQDLLPGEERDQAASLMCKNHKHRPFEVRAEQFVMAAGGIENARLLLNFRQFGASGLGNKHDNVGRFFSDHVGIKVGAAVIPQGEGWRSLYDPVARYQDQSDHSRVVGGVTLSESYIAKNTLRNSGMLLGFVDADQAREGGITVNPGDTVVQMYVSVEQEPNRRSRVSLLKDTDLLGMRKCRLNFRLSDSDRKAVAQCTDHYARLMSAEWKARVHLEDHAWPPSNPQYGYHHMGTTRMSISPIDGVVDPNCRIHGMKNVYVAGSSVFPTYSFVQPTFTITALTLRLAAYLKEQVNGG